MEDREVDGIGRFGDCEFECLFSFLLICSFFVFFNLDFDNDVPNDTLQKESSM